MASDVRKVRGSAQKTIVKAFEGLCGLHLRFSRNGTGTSF